ncbi:MAG TPA: gamma-glutamylcyclotransferase family protein [Reyranella sp.]|jgi:cation transport regulator ChaC|nr:gamma-glutamylcyclotransferase family protein [Reyranella sp.]
MIWYFAYGSNMNPARLADQRLKERAVQMGPRIGGRLDGWRLAFNKIARSPEGAAAGNIVEAPGEVVHGTLNQMPDAGLAVLDIWEGVAGGHYKRRTVPVVRADIGETVEAVTYIALKVGEGLRPTREYLGHLLAGKDLLPAAYWEKLKETPTLD